MGASQSSRYRKLETRIVPSSRIEMEREEIVKHFIQIKRDIDDRKYCLYLMENRYGEKEIICLKKSSLHERILKNIFGLH